jgi:glycosyltransferase involved in cell wall biosynthesis
MYGSSPTGDDCPERTVVLVANTAWYLLNFRANLIKALRSHNWVVHIVSPQADLFKELEQLGCKVHDIAIDNKGTNIINDLITMISFFRRFREIKPDLILNFTIKPVIYGTIVARALRLPTISTITGLGTLFFSNGFLKFVGICLYRVSLRSAACVVFQNIDDKRMFQDLHIIDSVPSVIIRGSGIDLKRFQFVPIPKTAIFRFLWVGRILKDKGIYEYVEAARIVKRQYQAVEFEVLGPSEVQNRTAVKREELETWEKQGIIRYLGSVKDVRKYMRQAHCIVLPSYREGLPRALLEGAATGRPLIASAVPGCWDIVEDGENGYLCKARTGVDLADKMLGILGLSLVKLEEMGRNGRRKVEKEFASEIIVNQYLGVIDESMMRVD